VECCARARHGLPRLFIKDRKFVKQPTEEELEAYASPPDGGSILEGIRGVFGGSSE